MPVLNHSSIINEVFWIRAIACLAVAVIHSVNTTLANYEDVIVQIDEYILIAIRFAAFFGTPAFVFISELLLSHVYPNHVPEDFFKKRITFLLCPFIFMGIVFAAITNNSISGFINDIFLNVFLGGYTGYFILIIFQFYILHYFFHVYLNKWSAKKMLLLSFAANILYLAFFNVTEAPSGQVGDYIWERGYWLLFVGWIFYFTLGYYCGKNYSYFKEKVLKHKRFVFVVPALAYVVMLFLVRTDILDVVSSKRVDNIFYTIGIISVIVFVSKYWEEVPRSVLFISKYSFQIYLLHKVVLHYLPTIDFFSPLLYFILVFVIAVLGAIGISMLLNRFSWSKYLIGRTLFVPTSKKKIS
ncbi:adhesin [Salibacterium salarium]|uniref:Adhesin n=1 Tax=Salibacterium salarium TaxID=284579 RepID=A0A3R9P539_9BACI|nr:acyltransferase family protein [Salibacterium salarium]RSL33044.1 adhesin [Salibacterium salarium]